MVYGLQWQRSIRYLSIDTGVSSYGSNAMLPVVADWESTGRPSIGVFEPNTGNWHLDNGNDQWDACSSTGDTCVTTYGAPGSLPVVKELSSEKVVVGTSGSNDLGQRHKRYRAGCLEF